MDNPRFHQQSRVRDHGHGRDHRARPFRVQPPARRADARCVAALCAGADQLPGCESGSCRDGRDQAARIRDQHGVGCEPHPLQLEGGPQRSLCRVPHVDGHDQGHAGCARQDLAGPARISAGRQGTAGHPCGPGEHAAGGLHRYSLADDEPARPDVVDRPDDREGIGKRAGRGAHRRQWRHHAANPRADQAVGADSLRRQRGPGLRGDPRGQPGCARRSHHSRPERLDRSRRRQDQGPGAIRADHRRHAGQRTPSICPRSPT